MPPDRVNVADRLTAAAANAGLRQQAVIARSKNFERTITFAQLEADAAALARGLVEMGVRPGTRLALLVPPSPEFVTLVFALLRSGATTILIDPGMGKKHLVDCLAAAEPEGFVAISKAQAVRTVMKRRFPHARLNVTVGRRWFWGGVTYEQLLDRGRVAWSRPRDHAPADSHHGHAPQHGHDGGPSRPCHAPLPDTHADDAAAIIFTSGSTGPPKGVLYTHRMFDAQASEIQRAYDIQSGGTDLACFALFGLFNAAWGVTTVFPHIDFSRPAAADPLELLAAANAHRVTQAFASPAIWDKLSRHCEASGMRIPSLRKVFSCGAPVRAEVVARTLKHVAPAGAQMHTPYGATEALPVATIEAQEILGETAARTSQGAGICVGRKFDSIEWRVIRITDEPIADIEEAKELPCGEIGELIVRGPQVSPGYAITELQPRALPGGGATLDPGFNIDSAAKNPRAEPGAEGWHRMGDVGYLDEQSRFWYCGRKSHRVETAHGPLYTECVEPIFCQMDLLVHRAAVVGIGPRPHQTPVIVYELLGDDGSFVDVFDDEGNCTSLAEACRQVPSELSKLARGNAIVAMISHFLHYGVLPVDIRHNAKINREELALWAARQLDDSGSRRPGSLKIS